MNRRAKFTSLLAVGVLLLAACGDDGSESSTEAGVDAAIDESGHEEGQAGEGGEEHGEEAMFGEPGDSAQADRVIEVVMNDDFTFDPDGIEVSAGETVTFELVNAGAIEHDFTIGDDATQDAHDIEMAEMADTDDPASGDDEGHGADSNALSLAAGERGELTWTFADPGEPVLFGCHVPGHYAAGMVGEFRLG